MKSTAVFNQDLFEHLSRRTVQEENSAPLATSSAFGLRGLPNVIGDGGERLPGAVNFLGDPLVEAQVAAFCAKIEQVALRQIFLMKHMQRNLSDPTFFAEFLPGIEFRYSQRIFLQGLAKFFDSNARTVFGAFTTGSGKTLMAAAALALLFARFPEGMRKPKILMLSPRTTLNEQHAGELEKFLRHVLSTADFGAFGDGSSVEITTMQRFSGLSEGAVVAPYDLVIIDELHRGLGQAHAGAIQSLCPQAVLLGLTATPYVGAGGTVKMASQFFEGCLGRVTLVESAAEGEIAPIRAVQLTLNTRAESPVTQSGRAPSDLALERNMNKPLRTQLAVAIAKRLPSDRKAVAFCAGVDHARDTAKALTDAGLPAEFIHGKMPKFEQQKILADFRSRKIRFLCNADILIEGFDDPEVTDGIMLRSTSALWLYEQMIGRIGRFKPGKIATIWDVVGQHSGAMTLAGLAAHYDALSENPQNGEVLFGKNKADEMDAKPSEIPPLGDGGDFAEFAPFLAGDFGVIEVDRTGFEPDLSRLDEAYFLDPELVRRGLEAFAANAGIELRDLMIFKDGMLKCNPVALSSVADLLDGPRNVAFSSYLKRALYVLGREGRLFTDGNVLKYFFELTEIPFPKEYSSLQELNVYFSGDVETVRTKIEEDLKGYCEAQGLARIQDISPEAVVTTFIQISEIGAVSLRDYLDAAVSTRLFGVITAQPNHRLDHFAKLLFGRRLTFLLDSTTYLEDLANLRRDWVRFELGEASFEAVCDRIVTLPNGERWTIVKYCRTLASIYLPASPFGAGPLKDRVYSSVFSTWRLLSVHPEGMFRDFREAYLLPGDEALDKALASCGDEERAVFEKELRSVLARHFNAVQEGKIVSTIFLQCLQSADLTQTLRIQNGASRFSVVSLKKDSISAVLNSEKPLRNLFRWYLLLSRCSKVSDEGARVRISQGLFLLDDETLRQACIQDFLDKRTKRAE